jgi:hypothetical protein
MTIVEFHRAAMDALAGDLDNIVLMDLIKQAHELSDMVGWADSIIDKEGKVSEAFTVLKDRARAKHESTGNKNAAILHDTVSDLLSAIYRHDNDLTPSTFADNSDTV